MPVLAIIGPTLYTIFLWWFLTGLIMAAYGRSRTIARVGFGVATALMACAFVGLWWTRDLVTPFGVYAATTCGIVIWSWQLTGYYLGFVTGPKGIVEQRDEPMSLPWRFWQTLRHSLYHEVVVLVFAVAMAAVVLNAGNRWGLWYFMTLWLLHVSAKLNVFFGVRNFHAELLPDSMRHLEVYLSRRRVNALFPVSVTLATVALVGLIVGAMMPTTPPATVVGCVIVSTMILLGIIEHWLLVLPVPATVWGWGLRALPASVHGPGDGNSDGVDIGTHSISERSYKG